MSPVKVEECESAEAIRAVTFNKTSNEIVALSSNGFIQIWSADTTEQKMSKKLDPCQESVCMAIEKDRMYAIGCRSETILLDARTLDPIKTIPARFVHVFNLANLRNSD